MQRSQFGDQAESIIKEIPRSSPLYQLNPFIDDLGLIRCRSRLQRSSHLTYEEKNPIILSGQDYLTGLLIYHMHATVACHASGVATNLHHLRARFLVLHARRTVKKVIRNCKICMRYLAKPASAPIPPLPAFRIEESKPFQFCGVDFAGPIRCKGEDQETAKSYIVLFVCAVTRAVHLELVPDLTAFEFMLVLRKFMSRFPAVARMISDNARTFKRVPKEFNLIMENVRNGKLRDMLTRHRVSWEFITDRAPTQGAF